MKSTLTAVASILGLGMTLAGSAWAQTAPAPAPQKSISVEAVAPFTAFDRWLGNVVFSPAAEPVTAQAFRFPAPAAAGVAYQPRPVILGLPDLPLTGEDAGQLGSRWGNGLNYQGVQMRLVVVNPANGKRELRPMSSGVRQGELFKLRVVSSFDAVADLDQIVGDGWSLQRANRVYPGVEQSVQISAGQSLDIPVDPAEHFSFNGDRINDRVVFSIRHAKAVKAGVSNQPVYRQDARNGSSYLQLVPRSQYPLIEQVITMRR